jgi:hypothetical protein
MTIKELLEYAAKNEVVYVQLETKLKFASSTKGIVGCIRIREGGVTGCGVMFEGTNWETWFHAKDDKDKRSRYMSQLSFFVNEHAAWWNGLTDPQREKVKAAYHSEYQFKVIRDLSDDEIKLVYSKRDFYDTIYNCFN